MKRKIPEVGPLEFRLLRILWADHPASAREVLQRYNGQAARQLAYTTVMTLLTRMAEKGLLEVDRSRQPFQFSPLISRDQLLRQRIRDFVDLFFEGRTLELALRLVEEGTLSEEGIRRLEELLARQREGGES